MNKLTAGLLIEVIAALALGKGDFFRPGVIVSAVMFVASLFVSLLQPIWGFELLHDSVVIILLSISLIILGDWLAIIMTRMRGTFSREKTQIQHIRVSNIIIFVIVAIDVVTITWHIYYLISTVGLMGSIARMAAAYRYGLVDRSIENNMPGMLSRLVRICSYFAFLALYIFINNIVACGNTKKSKQFIVPVILHVVDTLLNGSRGDLIYIIIAAVTYTFVILQRKNGWKVKQGFAYIRKIFIILFLTGIGFTALGQFVGRSLSGGIIYRFALYFGGGTALFNDFIKTGGANSPMFGACTFLSLNKFLTRRFGRMDLSDYIQYEFRRYNGINWGNVYTAVRRYYQDFGVEGVIILSLLFGIFFGLFYNLIRLHKHKNGFDFNLFLYGIMARAQFLYFFDDRFYSEYFSPSFIVTLLEMYICIIFVMKLSYEDRKLAIRFHRNGRR